VIDFLAMGGYATYVWSAYGITLAVMIISAWSARKRRLDAIERARLSKAHEQPRRQPTVRQVE
jgi:heme exporter protein D